ncbi:hypothetical protein BD311DRAFT_864198 [Dichomitus squalens]|uniref:Uncharacterized protein n=1 Tax=Dichomitus squalens TaxID=114155 RepID=A0A4Q9MR34_9APHY|nr:hypothetical protein BD311DRAFT_864198 [Dichomitus squalens]
MSELTTTRTTRHFRTLRNKCTALNSLIVAPPKPTVTITYGRSLQTRQPIKDDEPPPLAILQSLDKLGARLHLDRAIIQNMQLSKRIYEVRDTFRNIVQASFDGSREQLGETHEIPSLTSICARMIGELAQSEAEAAVHEDPSSEGREDQIRSQTIEGLYDNVPTQYRHFTLVAHALTYILDTCPHHPTLLNALLEVCVSFGLEPEARTVLLQLFTVAIQPRPHSTCPCPLTHPAHKNFLTSLRDTCTGSVPLSDVPVTDSNPVINNRTYTRILVVALSQPCPEQMHAWTSRAVTKLARDLREHDFEGCFVPLCAGLAHSIHQVARSRQKSDSSKHGKTLDDVHTELRTAAMERLAKWVGSMLDRLHARAYTPSGAVGLDYRACVDFLVDIEPLRLHVSTEPATSPTTCLADALCCLAVYCLVSLPAPPSPTLNPDLLVLESLLHTAHVKNTTFDGLVSHVFPLPSLAVFHPLLPQTTEETPTTPPTLPTPGDGSATAIDALAAPLRARGLHTCEVSLYISAMQHVEELIAAPVMYSSSSPSSKRRPLNEKELFDLRLQLMDRVEDAERRCYGSARHGASRAPEGEQEWVWEELVGSWVVKSPAVIKAKAMREKELARASKRRKLEDGRAAATRVQAPATSSSRSASRALPHSHEKENSSEHDDEESDDEEGEPTPAPRRIRSFATVLSDSRQNVISLRGERTAKNQTKAKPQEKAKPRASAPSRLPHVFAIPESPASASVSAPAPWTPVAPRRRLNFATALADSHKNAISLREERARREQGKASSVAHSHSRLSSHSHSTNRKRPFHALGRRSSANEDEDEEEGYEKEVGRRNTRVDLEPGSSPVRNAYVEPSSDDALNLFAYPDSSPVKIRRCGA